MQILTPSAVDNFKWNIDGLRKILLAENIRDKPVVVVSVAGAFRKGKSFLLGFFIRYLRNKGTDGWLGDKDTPLEGFSWRGGCDSDTKGILIWDEVFSVTTPDGREVAVLLMDTQGAFDNESTLNECVNVFGLSILMSSVQIYNISQNIQENDLEHLQLIVEYGRLAQEGTEKEPFQKLLFLVRDWQCPYQHPYGASGGKDLLEKWLHTTENQKPELKECRQHIRSCFSEIDCFLLPYPGEEAATSETFNGQLSRISEKFKDGLKELVPSVLAPENLLVKKVGDREITCKRIVEYFQACAQSFKDKVPKAQSILKNTADFQNREAVDKCLDIYKESMMKVWEDDVLCVDADEMKKDHDLFRSYALEAFDKWPKLGGDNVVNSFRESLGKEINNYFEYLATEKSAKSAQVRGNRTDLVNPISVGFLAGIPILGQMVLGGLALGDHLTRNSENAKETDLKDKRKLTRTVVKNHLGY